MRNFILACGLVASMSLAAAEFFVNVNTGNDANPGTSAGAPKMTIQAGIDAASANDTITVASGTYSQNITINKANLILRGIQAGVDARNRAIINETIIRPSSTATPTITVTANGIVIDGMLIEENSNSSGISQARDYSGCQYRNNIIRDNTCGMELNSNGAAQTIVEQNRFTQNNESGAASGCGIVSLQGLVNIQVRNNSFIDHDNTAILARGAVARPVANGLVTIQGNQLQLSTNGILLATCDTAVISGNTVNNCANGVQLAGDTRDVQVTNNVFTDQTLRVLYAASLLGYGNNANLTVTGNRIQQNTDVITAIGSLIELSDIAGQNTLQSNLMTLTGGFGAGVPTLHGVRITNSLTGDFFIAQNELDGGDFDGFDGATDSDGIRIENSVPSDVLITIQNNIIKGWVHGVENFAPVANDNIQIVLNNLGGNVGGGTAISHLGTGTLAASPNWFGNATGPSTSGNPGGKGARILGSISFTPWLVNGTDTVPLVLSDTTTYGFQTANPPALSSVPPELISAAIASPNPAVVAEVVLFAVVANDPDGEALTVTWTFGDGTSGTGASVTHAYFTIGVFTAVATITDATGVSVTSSTQVSVLQAPEGGPVITMNKCTIKAAVPTKSKDTLTLQGSFILPVGLTLLDGPITVSFGIYNSTFTLEKAKGKTDRGDSYSHKTQKINKVVQRESQFTYKAKDNLQVVLEAAGVNATTVGIVPIPIRIVFASVTYNGTLQLNITASTKKYQGKF